MKLSVPRTFNRAMSVTPPIDLKRPSIQKFSKDQVQTFKCRVDATNLNSNLYDIAVPYFSDGTPEEWIYFQRHLNRAYAGQGDTNGGQRYAKIRMLLQGEALAAFESQVTATDNHTETLDTLDRAIQAVSACVFPDRAAQIQKRYLRRFLRKPVEMSTKKYVARIVKVNNFFDYFPHDPSTKKSPKKLDDNKLVDILEFGCPPK